MSPNGQQPGDPHPAAPSGIGWWIWYLDKALHGRTLEQFAEVCKTNHITHLYIKAGDANNPWPQFAPAVGPLRAAGLKVYSWNYVYAGNPPRRPDYSPESTAEGEAAVAIAALASGADGHVFDIEAECEGRVATVDAMWQVVRERYPQAWLAYAPLPWVDFHNPPLYSVSNRYADAVLPQFYCQALGPQYGNLDRLFDQWHRWANVWRNEGHLPSIHIIGQAYAATTAEDITQLAERCKAEGVPSLSWWEWSGSTDAQWEAVAAVAAAWPPAPTPTPIPTPNADVEVVDGPNGPHEVDFAFLNVLRQLPAIGRPLGPAAYSADRCLQAFENATLVWESNRPGVDILGFQV